MQIWAQAGIPEANLRTQLETLNHVLVLKEWRQIETISAIQFLFSEFSSRAMLSVYLTDFHFHTFHEKQSSAKKLSFPIDAKRWGNQFN